MDSATNVLPWSHVLQLFCHKVEATNAILSVAESN